MVGTALPACGARGTLCSASARRVCARGTAPPLGTPGGRRRASRVRVRPGARAQAAPLPATPPAHPPPAEAQSGLGAPLLSRDPPTLPHTWGLCPVQSVPQEPGPPSAGLANPSAQKPSTGCPPTAWAAALGRRSPECGVPIAFGAGKFGGSPRPFPSTVPAHHVAFLGPHRRDVNFQHQRAARSQTLGKRTLDPCGPAPPPRACRPRPGRSRAPPGPARGRLGWTPGGGKQARPFEPSGTAVRGDLSAERHPFVNVSTFIECAVIARIAG